MGVSEKPYRCACIVPAARAENPEKGWVIWDPCCPKAVERSEIVAEASTAWS